MKRVNIFLVLVCLFIIILINSVILRNETVYARDFEENKELNNEERLNVNQKNNEQAKEYQDNRNVENKNELKIEEKINPEDIINFNEIKEQKKIKIGVMTIPGTKVRNFMEGNNKISFTIVNKPFNNKRELFPQTSPYDTIYNFNIRNKIKEKNYTFEYYREDMVLSYPFYELLNQNDLDQYDYIYIPELGMKFTEEIVNDLYENIIYSRKTFEETCFYQVTPYNSLKIKKQKTKTDFNLLTVNYPETRFKECGSILIHPQTLRRLEYFGKQFFHIDRIDRNLQVFCDIVDLKIVVFPRK